MMIVYDDRKMFTLEAFGVSLTAVSYSPRVVSNASRVINYAPREHF